MGGPNQPRAEKPSPRPRALMEKLGRALLIHDAVCARTDMEQEPHLALIDRRHRELCIVREQVFGEARRMAGQPEPEKEKNLE